MLFGCGYYRVVWKNKVGDIVKDEVKYLTAPLWNREVINMQTAFLRGEDVVACDCVSVDDEWARNKIEEDIRNAY